MSGRAAIIASATAIAICMAFVPCSKAAAENGGELDAAIIGPAEFVPGATATVRISIQNNKTPAAVETVAVQAGLSQYYGSAVGVSAVLSAGDAPITIRTGKVLLGTLACGATAVPASFTIEVSRDAVPGSYLMVLELRYQELTSVKAGLTAELRWANKVETKELKIQIKEPGKAVVVTEELDAAIINSSALLPGKTAVVQISIQNTNAVVEKDVLAIQAGLSDYYGCAFGLTANLKEGNAPVTVKTDKVLLGTVPAGTATPPVPFTVEVKGNARPGLYNMLLELAYKELSSVKMGEKVKLEWVDRIVTKYLTIQIEDNPLEFEVTSNGAALHPGVQREIRFTFKNNGSHPARDCEAKISAVIPISVTDDTAFLGDIEPGNAAVGVFRLKIKGDATPKEYVINAQIKYTDYKGEEQLSRVIKVPVKVRSRSSSMSEFVRDHLVGGLIGAGIVAAIWIIWFVWFRVKPIVID